MDFKNLNKSNPFIFDVPEGTEFKNLKELNPAYVYTLLTVHMNTKGKFGEYAIGAVVCDDTGEINWVSFPSHLNDVFTDIMYNEEYVAGVNNRQCKFRRTSFVSKKYNKTGYGVEFL